MATIMVSQHMENRAIPFSVPDDMPMGEFAEKAASSFWKLKHINGRPAMFFQCTDIMMPPEVISAERTCGGYHNTRLFLGFVVA